MVNMRPNLKQWLVSIAVFAALALGGEARAETSTVVVYGTTSAKDQTVIAAAITGALKHAQWSVIDLPYSSAEITDIVACLDGAHPWPCIEPFAKAKGVARLVMVHALPEKAGGIKLVGQIVVSNDGVPQIEQQYCNPCSPSSLASTAAELAGLLSKHTSGSATQPSGDVTGIHVHTAPKTAAIRLDDQSVNATEGIIPTTAGTHRVSIQLAGYKPVSREITVVDGRLTPVDETLVRMDQDDGGTDPPSRLVPGLVIVGGAVALFVGSAISWTAKPGPGEDHHENYYSGPALVVAGVGGLAIAGGIIYLLVRHPTHKASSPTVSITPDGAVGGWTTSF